MRLAQAGAMRAFLVVLLLAGCTSPPAPQVPDPDVMLECPSLPTGDPWCEGQAFAQATSDQRPDPTQWKCTRQWTDDGAHLELYMTLQGRLGLYWEWTPWRDDGLAYQRLALYTAPGQGHAQHVAYQPQGFVALPGTYEGEGAEIQRTLGILRIHAKIDGQWVQDPANASFLVDSIDGDLWVATRFDWPGGPYFVNNMRPQESAGRMEQWVADGWQGTVADVDVIIDHAERGARTTNVNLATFWLSPECAYPE